MYLEDSINLMNQKLIELKSENNIVIWGAGENTVRLFQYTDILKYSIKEIVDNRIYKYNFFGKTVKHPRDIVWSKVKLVVISTFLKEDEIEKELIYEYNFRGKILKLYCDKPKKPFYNYVSKKDIEVPRLYKKTIEKNSKFKNIHEGERIFVLCTGPSINNLDLYKLKDEYTIAVSNFYMHKDIKTISPNYYCLPKIVYSDKITNVVAKNWIKDIVLKGHSTEYFFSISEKEIIESDPIFDREKINYIYYDKIFQNYDSIDLSKQICGIETAPTLCIEIALYMGFKEIILLGVEYSHYISNKYKYFYDRDKNIIGHLDSNVDAEEFTKWSLKDKIISMNRVWNQFENMKLLAEAYGCKIYNATENSVVDIFEKVSFNSFFER